MNNCLLEVEVKKAPTIRYTQDQKTPIAEMEVSFEGLRPDDSPSEIKVVGWGNIAQDLPNQVHIGQKVVLEGRLRMNTVPRQDGTKEKRAEFTLSKVHTLSSVTSPEGREGSNPSNLKSSPQLTEKVNSAKISPTDTNSPSWDSSPLIPDTDEIPF